MENAGSRILIHPVNMEKFNGMKQQKSGMAASGCGGQSRPLRKRSSSTSICELREVLVPKRLIEHMQTSNERINDNMQQTSNSSYDKSEEMKDYINQLIFFPRHRSSSGSSSSSSTSSSSSSSSNSECLGSQVIEEEIQPTQTTSEEAAYKFNAQLRNPTSDAKWTISEARESGPIKAELSVGRYTLYGWKLNNEDYVFGFEDSDGKYFYIKTPDAGDRSYPFLSLSSADSDPSNITDPSSDLRCLSYKYDRLSNKFHLHPCHNLSQTVDIESNGYLCVKTTQPRLAREWSIS